MCDVRVKDRQIIIVYFAIFCDVSQRNAACPLDQLSRISRERNNLCNTSYWNLTVETFKSRTMFIDSLDMQCSIRRSYFILYPHAAYIIYIIYIKPYSFFYNSGNTFRSKFRTWNNYRDANYAPVLMNLKQVAVSDSKRSFTCLKIQPEQDFHFFEESKSLDTRSVSLQFFT